MWANTLLAQHTNILSVSPFLPEVRLLILAVTKHEVTYNIDVICLPIHPRLLVAFADLHNPSK
jgi:hypothetical protein